MVKTEQVPDFFQSVVKYGSDLITIINQDGLYTYVSDSVTRLLGYSTEEMVGASPFEHIHQDDLEMVMYHFQQLALKEQLTPPLFRYKHKDGSWRWLDCTATNMLLQENINGFVTNSRDVTERVEAEKKRKESKAFYEALYFNHPDLVFTCDKYGVIKDCNDSVYKITGYNLGEVLNRNFIEFLTNKNREVTQDGFMRALSGKAHTLETSILSKSNRVVELNVTLVPVVLNAKVEAVQCIAIDVTEKKRAVQLLNDQTRQLNNILGSITEAFFALDEAFRFTYINTTFADYIRHQATDLIGKSIWEKFPLMTKTYFYEKCLEVTTSGEAVECEEYIDQIDSILSWRIYPFENGIAVCFTDVTAKKKAIEEQKNLSFVASKTTNGVLITNNRGQIDWVNKSFETLSGFTLPEIAGKDPSDFLYGPETQVETIEHIRRMLELRVPFTAEFINYKKSGEAFWVALVITPILDERGELTKFINIYTDINDRKKAEVNLLQLSDSLFQQNRDLQQFTYIVSHNLRAPVANVVGLTKMLQKLDVSSPQYEVGLKNLEKSAMRLDTVIKDLNKILAVKKVGQEGTFQNDSELVDLTELVSEVVQSLQEMLTTAKAKVELCFSSDVCLSTKRAYIYSIIHNLLTNAIKYRSDVRDLLISVSIVEDKGNVVITVNDNGSGMDMDKVKPHLFKLYKRFHHHIEGKGLGLYLVKSQVEALDGTIEVESELGKGTNFKISFKSTKHDKESIYN